MVIEVKGSFEIEEKEAEVKGCDREIVESVEIGYVM